MKVKPSSKTVVHDINLLEKAVVQTTTVASQVVGSTLGPFGKVVLIERSENLPPYTTKDGITVFNALAMPNSVSQVVLEALRNASSKTNSEAGDGTTTATILADALVQNGLRVLKQNPHLSTQAVVREIEEVYNNIIEPEIKKHAISLQNKDTEEMMQLLHKVALISTNSDKEMADAVIKCFDLVGLNGHVNIVEASGGVSGYEVEKIEGFPIARGFEESCGRYLEEFINDKGNYKVVLEKPRFILYNGKINSLSTLLPAIEKLSNAFDQALAQNDNSFSPNIVVVAHAFSDEVLAALAHNFKQPSTLNIFPLKTPMTIQTNSPYHFLVDLSAFTGASIFDPLTRPLTTLELKDMGIPSMQLFEAQRHRSLVIGEPDELLIVARASELEYQVQNAASSLDAELTKERLGILTGGIARLKVRGSSEVELKEKKHRVEDAVLAIKGALQYGIVPGGGKILLWLADVISSHPQISAPVKKILQEAFVQPFERLYKNGGWSFEEYSLRAREIMYEQFSIMVRVKWQQRLTQLMKTVLESPFKLFNWQQLKAICSPYQKVMRYQHRPVWYTYNLLTGQYGHGIDIGVIDSAAAVLLSIKNAIAVAKMLMGLSAIIAFQRDKELERNWTLQELSDTRDKEWAERQKQDEIWNPWNYQ